MADDKKKPTPKKKKLTAAKKPKKSIRATNANQGVVHWYQTELNKLIKRMNKSVISNVKSVWNKSASTITGVLNALGIKWNKMFDDKATGIADMFVKKVDRATTTSMKNAYKQAGFKVNGKGANVGLGFNLQMRKTKDVQKVLTSLRDTQVNLIKSIPEQHLDRVAGIVQRGVQNGRNFKYIEEKLLEEFALTPKRARMIAVDQSNKATQAIKMTRDEMIGIEEGIWIHIAGRFSSRETHKKMNGKRFKLRGENAGLYDEAVGENVLPAQLVNCYCSYRPVIPELFE